MQESARCFHNLEWPAPGARLAGPVAWLRGWIVGKPGHDFLDVRARHDGATHLGVLGLPRTDLAHHFHAEREWLPAGFIVGVPVAEGELELTLEAMDASGRWEAFTGVRLTIAADGQPAPQVEGRVVAAPGGSCTVRDAHHPFHGHLDEPGAAPQPRRGRARILGWLLDETQPLAGAIATTDGVVFHHLAHSLVDESLPARVAHPGARQARLRGEVDLPATLSAPACLRVYAISPGGAVHLCFAQRLEPVPPEGALRPPATELREPPPPRVLPALPSGRPRRLLLVVRSLLPGDATLRALDLAQHLVGSRRWAARLVSSEDGPLRADFERAGVESLIVDPDSFFRATDAPAAERALGGLQRRIWWKHLDAVAVFDPGSSWAAVLARQQGIPVLFDCLADEPLEPDPTAHPSVIDVLRTGWRSATAVSFGSIAAARAQGDRIGATPALVIPQWHSLDLPAAPGPGARVAIAPLRTAVWLTRHHPDVGARWTFRQGPAALMATEELARHDDKFNLPVLQRSAEWDLHGVSLCLGPLFDRGPLRPVLDAAAAGIPLVAPRVPTTSEYLAGTGLALVDENNPLALAHALLAFEAEPRGWRREAAAVRGEMRARHAPERWLPRWAALLDTTAASRG